MIPIGPDVCREPGAIRLNYSARVNLAADRQWSSAVDPRILGHADDEPLDRPELAVHRLD